MDSGAVRAPVSADARRSRRNRLLCYMLLAAVSVGVAVLLLVVLLLNEPLAPVIRSAAGRAAKARFEEDLAAVRAQPIDLEMFETLRYATVAYEDRAYFSRAGWVFPVSISGTLRAIWRNLSGIREGGSTIPAQLAKLYFAPGSSRSIGRKLHELLLATWMVREAHQEEILSLYLNRSAARFFAHDGPSAGQLERLSLALFGLSLGKLSREDQLLLAATPRGVRWHRKRPQRAVHRIAAARGWLSDEGYWDARVPSWIEGVNASDVKRLFSFVDGWEELVATDSATDADLDLARVVDRFRTGLADEVLLRFPGVALRAGIVVVGTDGVVYARSGAETSVMLLNYGSIAKLEPLTVAVEFLGVESVRALAVPPRICVRWFWTRHRSLEAGSTRWCPTNVVPAQKPLAFDEAVAHSVNDVTARHVALLPYRIALANREDHVVLRGYVPAREWTALDSKADRAIAANLLFTLGQEHAPEDIPEDLSYSPLQVAWFRYLNARRRDAGLPSGRLPEDPTQTLGNSSRATLEQVAHYAHRRLFDGSGYGCRLSETGALLAIHRNEGTLR